MERGDGIGSVSLWDNGNGVKMGRIMGSALVGRMDVAWVESPLWVSV